MLNLLLSNTLLPLTYFTLLVFTKENQVSVNIIHLLFTDSLVPLTSSPANCKHAKFQATSPQNIELDAANEDLGSLT
jgi:hypothetical protein